jgi:hypothetical protein
VVASSSHCNPPISRRVLSSGLIDNAAGRRASAFRVVVDCVFILVDEAGKTWVELSSLTKSGRVRAGRGSTRVVGVLPEEVLSDEDRLDDMFAFGWMRWNGNWSS